MIFSKHLKTNSNWIYYQTYPFLFHIQWNEDIKLEIIWRASKQEMHYSTKYFNSYDPIPIRLHNEITQWDHPMRCTMRLQNKTNHTGYPYRPPIIQTTNTDYPYRLPIQTTHRDDPMRLTNETYPLRLTQRDLPNET